MSYEVLTNNIILNQNDYFKKHFNEYIWCDIFFTDKKDLEKKPLKNLFLNKNYYCKKEFLNNNIFSIRLPKKVFDELISYPDEKGLYYKYFPILEKNFLENLFFQLEKSKQMDHLQENLWIIILKEKLEKKYQMKIKNYIFFDEIKEKNKKAMPLIIKKFIFQQVDLSNLPTEYKNAYKLLNEVGLNFHYYLFSDINIINNPLELEFQKYKKFIKDNSSKIEKELTFLITNTNIGPTNNNETGTDIYSIICNDVQTPSEQRKLFKLLNIPALKQDSLDRIEHLNILNELFFENKEKVKKYNEEKEQREIHQITEGRS